MPLNGDRENKKWILQDAKGLYLIGHFDGKTFKQEQDAFLMDVGPENNQEIVNAVREYKGHQKDRLAALKLEIKLLLIDMTLNYLQDLVMKFLKV